MENSQNIDLKSLVDEHTESMLSWAIHKVSDPELAKDLVQDTFLAAAEKMDTFKGNSLAKTWLFSILNHKIIDHYRKKIKQPIVSENEILGRFFESNEEWRISERPQPWDTDQGHLLDNIEFNEMLKMCLEALPEKWHLAVKTKYLLNKSGDEICQELEITPTNFWQIIHRAKLQLRDCVSINWFKN